jgi:hypothetical protein
MLRRGHKRLQIPSASRTPPESNLSRLRLVRAGCETQKMLEVLALFAESSVR